MSQRGNKVFFDACETVFNGNTITVATGDASKPTTFNTNNFKNSLKIANEWNGVTIDNGTAPSSIEGPNVCFGPDENFYAMISASPGYGFMVHMANNIADVRFSVSDGGHTNATGNVYVSKNVIANGQIRSIGPTGSRIASSQGADGDFYFDVETSSFCYMNDSYDNTLYVFNANFGDRLFLQLEGSGILTLGTDFKTSNSRFITKGNTMLSFIFDGQHMVELTRSTY
jgi:hypothetical protein